MALEPLGVLRLGAGVAIHLGGPLQEAQQFQSLAPHEPAEFQKADAVHLDARVGLNAPAEIRAAPWRQVMAARGVPDEEEDVAHRSS